MPQGRVLSTDPNAGEPLRTSGGAPRVLSTDPNAGEPLRVATKGENLPTWSDKLGLNEPTDSMIHGFHRGMGGAAVDMAQGAASVIGDLMHAKLKTDQGIDAPQLQTDTPQTTAGTVGSYLPTVAEMAVPVGGAVKGAKAAVGLLPNTASAGAKFQDVMSAAKNIPLDVKEVGDVALRINQLAERGGSMPMAVRKILNRMTDPNKAAMTYEEGRDFASNISRLSANEYGRLTPAVAREVAGLRVALNQANANAAKAAGKMDEYKSAMREYARAMRLREAIDKSVKVAKKAAPYAAGAGIAAWMSREIRSMLSP